MSQFSRDATFETGQVATAEVFNRNWDKLEQFLNGRQLDSVHNLKPGGSNPSILTPANAGRQVRANAEGVAEWADVVAFGKTPGEVTLVSNSSAWQKAGGAVTPGAGTWRILVTAFIAPLPPATVSFVPVVVSVSPSVGIPGNKVLAGGGLNVGTEQLYADLSIRKSASVGLDTAPSLVLPRGDGGRVPVAWQTEATLSGSEEVALYGLTSNNRTCTLGNIQISCWRVS